MSVHPSLSSKGKNKRTRSVLKRFEKLNELRQKDKWKPGDSIFGLPKIKAVRWKAKKTKKAAEAEAPAGEQAVHRAQHRRNAGALAAAAARDRLAPAPVLTGRAALPCRPTALGRSG